MTGDSILGGLNALGTSQLRADKSALDSATRALGKVDGDVRAAAQDFEAFYLTQAMANMFAGIETDPLFGGGAGEGVFRSLLTQEYGKLVANAGGIGIADSVAREMLKLQEAA